VVSEIGEEIGRLGVTYDTNNMTADLSIMMGAKEHWGQGYGTEAWTAMLDHLLKTYRKVTAGTMRTNRGMVIIFHRSGMEVEAIRKKHFLWEDQEVDLIMACKFA